MENGSLDMWLHPEKSEATRSRSLNILQRLNIAIDAASALYYLHNQCGTVIVHCDLKPSNILLYNGLTAHVGDFGLARLLPRADGNSSSGQGTSSSLAINGTIGYVGPEYGMGCETSTQGDVYSYGIVLLEMFTGRRPTDGIFKDDLDLHNYVKMHLPDQIMKIIDPFLLSRETEENQGLEPIEDETKLEQINGSNVNPPDGTEDVVRCISSMFEIGIEVLRQLQLIRDAFLHGERNRASGS